MGRETTSLCGCVLLKPFDSFHADPHRGSDLLDYLIVFLLVFYDNLAAGL